MGNLYKKIAGTVLINYISKKFNYEYRLNNEKKNP